jgi:N-dimethylarginine dimethylaminohydrolase
MRVLIEPTTFEILNFQKNQNPYIMPEKNIRASAIKDHHSLVDNLDEAVVYRIDKKPPMPLPDIVFMANGGFSLWGLERVMILPQMKYKQRKDELPYLKDIFQDLGLTMYEFPSKEPFEGQAEAKWFHDGKLLVCGYGHRSTKKSFEILDKLLKKIYKSYGLLSPKLLVLPLESADYYHLDVAMLEFGDSCIIHKRAFSPESVKKLQHALGKDKVHVIDTEDNFCLNAVVQGKTLLTHIVSDSVKKFLEDTTGLRVIQNPTPMFEKSGGSVRCMILDIHPIYEF